MPANPASFPPSQSSAAGGDGAGYSSSNGMMATPLPPKTRPSPWPFPDSAYQGSVGGAGGIGFVAVSPPPYYQPYQKYWPYQAPAEYWPHNIVVKI